MTKKHRSIYISKELLEKINEERRKYWEKTGKEISFNAIVTEKLEDAFNFVTKAKNSLKG